MAPCIEIGSVRFAEMQEELALSNNKVDIIDAITDAIHKNQVS